MEFALFLGELRPVKSLAFRASGARISAPRGSIDSGVAASERGRRGLSVEPAFKPLGPGLRFGARTYGGPYLRLPGVDRPGDGGAREVCQTPNFGARFGGIRPSLWGAAASQSLHRRGPLSRPPGGGSTRFRWRSVGLPGVYRLPEFGGVCQDLGQVVTFFCHTVK
ncbi:hypothetical protein M9458_050826, partial [Cirrhinus mrigala]